MFFILFFLSKTRESIGVLKTTKTGSGVACIFSGKFFFFFNC